MPAWLMHVADTSFPDDIVRVAAVGDIVAIHFVCKDEDGGVSFSSDQ